MASKTEVENFIAGLKASNTLGRFDPDGFIYDDQGRRVGYERTISDEALALKVSNHLDQSNAGAAGVRNAPSALVVGHIENPIVTVQETQVDLSKADPDTLRDIRQEIRRKEEAQKLAMGLTVNRVAPGPSSNLIYITMEQFKKLQQEYAQAKEAGVSDSRQEFLPFSVYSAKFVRSGIPLLQNELGRFQGTKRPKLNGKIAVLRDKEFSVNTTVVGPSIRHE